MRAQRVLKRVCVCRVQRKFPFCALSSDDKIKLQRKERIILSESLARTRLIKSLIRTPKSVLLTQIWLCKCLFLTPRERLSSLYFALKFGPKRHKAFLHFLRENIHHTKLAFFSRIISVFYSSEILHAEDKRGRRNKQTRALFIPHARAPSLR